MVNNDTFQVITLLQNLTNSLNGQVNIYDSNYIEDVKKRMPHIESAFNDLKKYLEKHN